MKFLSRFYMVIVFGLLYAPILVMIVFSFNSTSSMSNFTGFSFKWYVELFKDSVALNALKNSLILAVSSALLSTIIGTLAAYGLSRMRSKWLKSTIRAATNIPMMNPDVVTGASLLLLFSAAFTVPFLNIGLGFVTMLIAHTTFNLPYVILSVLPKFKQMDPHLTEAALDLGCTPARAFMKIEVPYVMPGIISGMMLAFTLSLDDFIISYFISSPDFETLPLYVETQTAHNVKHSMYALFSLIVLTILVIMLLVNFVGGRDKKEKTKKNKKHAKIA